MPIEDGIDVVTRQDNKVEKPKMYKAILHNDDFSHPLAVVLILTDVYKKTKQEALEVMLQAHNEGTSVCGVYQKDVCETKVIQSIDAAKKMEQALKFTAEPDE